MNQGLHLANGLRESDEYGSRYDRVSDVEFAHAVELCDGLYIAVGEAVTSR